MIQDDKKCEARAKCSPCLVVKCGVAVILTTSDNAIVI